MTPEIVEINFKGNRRLPFYNPKEIQIKPGDAAIVEAEKGIDLGFVTKVGRLVTMSDFKGEPRNLIRKAGDDDLRQLDDNREKESLAFLIGREKIKSHNLNMKLVDVEYQFDLNRLTFYFTSDKRVDFRNLVKDLAAKYRTRIELRQIGVRDEARRLGGLGVCGRDLCCASFIDNFEPVSTQNAKDQNLSLNPCKLTGVCGRLKCCLAFEKDFYASCQHRFPQLNSTVTIDGKSGVIDKIDIFQDAVFLRYGDDDDLSRLTLTELNEYQMQE